jgi:hypothetical protein
MLTASLVLSGVLLLVANLAARYSKHPVRVTLAWAVAVTMLPLMAFTFFPVVWLQAGLLGVALVICGGVGCRTRWISFASVASVLVAYGVIGLSANDKEREYARLRSQYPFESMEPRLPRPVPASATGDVERLKHVEQAIGDQTNRGREMALARLHSDATQRFARTPGLGVGRMSQFSEPTPWNLQSEPRNEAPAQQDYFPSSMSLSDSKLPRPTQAAIDSLHEAGFLDFVNPRGFGYVKDRRHVAGFESHGFTRFPEPTGDWKVATVDLVGLLLHDTPVVYVSAKLPRMEELRDAPTRPLDAFESSALAALQKGADMHIADGTESVRFVGSLRNAGQCVECHGGERGALLGAFSYRLQPKQ